MLWVGEVEFGAESFDHVPEINGLAVGDVVFVAEGAAIGAEKESVYDVVDVGKVGQIGAVADEAQAALL